MSLDFTSICQILTDNNINNVSMTDLSGGDVHKRPLMVLYVKHVDGGFITLFETQTQQMLLAVNEQRNICERHICKGFNTNQIARIIIDHFADWSRD